MITGHVSKSRNLSNDRTQEYYTQDRIKSLDDIHWQPPPDQNQELPKEVVLHLHRVYSCPRHAHTELPPLNQGDSEWRAVEESRLLPFCTKIENIFQLITNHWL